MASMPLVGQLVEQLVVAGQRVDEHARLGLEGQVDVLFVGMRQNGRQAFDQARQCLAPALPRRGRRRTRARRSRRRAGRRCRSPGRENRLAGRGRPDRR